MYRIEAQFTNFLDAPDLFKECHRKVEYLKQDLKPVAEANDNLVKVDSVTLKHEVLLKKEMRQVNLPIFVIRLAFLLKSLMEVKQFISVEVDTIIIMTKQVIYQLQDEVQLINSFKLLWILTKQDAFMECFEKVIRETEGYEDCLLI